MFLLELEQSRKLKPSYEATLNYYFKFLDSSRDTEFIESLFFTNLKQAEDLIPLLNGLLLKEICARFSQKVTEELIKAEESEKMGSKKKKKKRKSAAVKKINENCPYCPKSPPCEIFSYTKIFASKITKNVIDSSLLDILPEETVYDLKKSEYETSISVVSDTTRKCRFHFSSILKKQRCTSNSREKVVKPPVEDADTKRFLLAQSEITTLLDSNTDFESVADSMYEGSLKQSISGKNKGIEPPIFNNKKERKLSHEKYEQISSEQKVEDKKVSECEDFIEVKRKRSVKDHSAYITNSACKPSMLKGTINNKLEKKQKNVCISSKNTNNNQGRLSIKVCTTTSSGGSKYIPNSNKNINNTNNKTQSIVTTSNYTSGEFVKQKEQKELQIVQEIKESTAISKNIKKTTLIEKKLSREISNFMDGMKPKIEELRVFRGLVLKRLRYIVACLFPRILCYNYSFIFSNKISPRI